MKSYVVLLRGINVGGKNKISMSELKMCLEGLGLKDVKTYINSGNVIVKSDLTQKRITERIEKQLPKTFELDSNVIKVLVLSHEELQHTINTAPVGFGNEPTKYHSDVIFLIDIDADDALSVFTPKAGVDKVWKGNNVIYSQRLSEERSKSRLGKIIGTPQYQAMTIRTWGTTTKLLALMETSGVSRITATKPHRSLSVR